MDETLDRLGQIGHGGGRGLAGAGIGDGVAQLFDRAAHLAGDRGAGFAGKIVHGGGKPVFQVDVEAVLRLARLQVEEAEHERAGETEQRGREGDAHAGERRGEAFLQGVEHGAGIAAEGETLDHPAHRADGFDQAPEGAEQAEENQQAGHVARDVARFVEPGCN